MKKYIKLLLAIIFVAFIISTNIYAAENEVKITKVPYSKEYEEWLNLPEDVRKNSIAPAMYDVDESVVENLRQTNSNTNTRSLLRNSALPSYYNTLDEMEIKVKNQQSRGLCWDFAFTSAAEIACKKYENETYEFSPLHIDYGTITRFKDRINPYAQPREYSKGGTIQYLQGYLSSGQGPILEEYMPYDEGKGEINYSDMPNRLPSKFIDLQEIIAINSLKKMEICSGTREYTSDELLSRESIKRKIIQSGGLWAVTYMGNYTKNQNTVVYNETNQIPTEGPDYKTATHAIVLIGYDDNYSADNFGNEILPKPKHDGAYIALNSWGEYWGDNGIFYISYDDVWVESDLGYIKNTSDVDYDNIYQHNYGNNSYLAFDLSANEEKQVFTANIFDRDITKREQLTKLYIPFFIVKRDVNIEVYVNPMSSDLNTGSLTKVECDVNNINQGENYINLTTPIELTGEKYAVVIKYIANNSTSEVNVPIQNNAFNVYPDAEHVIENQSFYSFDGENWSDSYNGFNYNTRGAGGGDVQVNPHYAIVLKAITKSIDKDIEIIDINAKNSDVIYSDAKHEISAYVTTTANLNGEKLNVKILKDNTDVTDKFDIVSLPDVKSRASDIKFNNKETIDTGTYVFQVYTQDGLTAEKEFVVADSLENSEELIKFEYEDEIFLSELYTKLNGFKDNTFVPLTDNQIYVKKDYANSIDYMDVGTEDASEKITSIKGIEIFSNLQYLHIENAHLSNLDEIYKLNKLESLTIFNSSFGVDTINLKNMSDMFELYLVNCELNDDVKINVRDGLTTICLDKNHLSKIPKELYENARFFNAADQTITDEMEFEQNDSYVLIDLPEILTTAPASYLTFENCEYDEASGKIRIYTTNLGQGEAIIEMPRVDIGDYNVADPYYSFGSKYTVKYNVVEKKNIDDIDNNEDETIDEKEDVIEKQEDKNDRASDDVNPKTGSNIVVIYSLILLSLLILLAISMKLKIYKNSNVK